jgi:hypothetical protein
MESVHAAGHKTHILNNLTFQICIASTMHMHSSIVLTARSRRAGVLTPRPLVRGAMGGMYVRCVGFAARSP